MPVETRIQLRQDTATNWTTTNPVLAAGEAGYDLTNKRIKVGNGTLAWNALEWTTRQVFVQTEAPTTGMVAGDIWITG